MLPLFYFIYDNYLIGLSFSEITIEVESFSYLSSFLWFLVIRLPDNTFHSLPALSVVGMSSSLKTDNLFYCK